MRKTDEQQASKPEDQVLWATVRRAGLFWQPNEAHYLNAAVALSEGCTGCAGYGARGRYNAPVAATERVSLTVKGPGGRVTGNLSQCQCRLQVSPTCSSETNVGTYVT